MFCRWETSLSRTLGKYPEFVDTGEREVGKVPEARPIVWRFDPPAPMEGEPQQKRRRVAGAPYLGKRGLANG